MKTHDFYFELPQELIAQTPIERRDASRLLVLDKTIGAWEHRHFFDLPQYLHPGDCLILNDSRVLPARLLGQRLPGGGACEVLLLIDRGDKTWECLVRPGKKMRKGARVSFGDGQLTGEITEELPGGNRLVRFDFEGIFLEVLDRLGKMPLPPYIKEELQDRERYQTVYSKVVGSAAAPTAGLHFTKELLAQVQAMGVGVGYVTLHVGLGTFRPVKEEEITDHEMHSEYCVIPQETAELSIRPRAGGRRWANGAPHRPRGACVPVRSRRRPLRRSARGSSSGLTKSPCSAEPAFVLYHRRSQKINKFPDYFCFFL